MHTRKHRKSREWDHLKKWYAEKNNSFIIVWNSASLTLLNVTLKMYQTNQLLDRMNIDDEKLLIYTLVFYISMFKFFIVFDSWCTDESQQSRYTAVFLSTREKSQTVAY